MQRMTDVLSRMLNDPMTRAALSAGGEDSLDQESQNQDDSARDNLSSSAATVEAVVNNHSDPSADSINSQPSAAR